MRVLVSDTSVIIDLERGSLLQDLFRLPFEFAVPDLLFHRELKGVLGEQLIALGLRVEELTPDEVGRATSVRRANLALSVPDSFAFSLATVRGWTLLTGDGGLRQLAASTGLNVHGVLWLLDHLEAGRHVPNDRLHTCLTDYLNPSALSTAGTRCQKAPRTLRFEDSRLSPLAKAISSRASTGVDPYNVARAHPRVTNAIVLLSGAFQDVVARPLQPNALHAVFFIPMPVRALRFSCSAGHEREPFPTSKLVASLTRVTISLQATPAPVT